MGRKPNQLILEFFERGPKLEDNSNRYQHTCKACGEKFPKGRIDSLTNHLTKKCPAIAMRDRQRAALHLHELPDFVESEPVSGRDNGVDLVKKGQTLELPYANRKLTALETLAEVSRQHVHLATRSLIPLETAAEGPEGQDEAVGRFLSDEERWSHGTPPPAVNGHAHIDPRLTDPATASALPPIQYFGSISDSPTSSPHLPSLSLPTSSSALTAHAPSSLCLSTPSTDDFAPLASATFTMEPDLGVPNECISDKFFHAQGPRTSTWPMVQQSAQPDGVYFEGPRDHNGMHEATTTRASTFPRAIAMNPNAPQRAFNAEFSTSPKPSRPKVRGRFTATRRKEVQEVRKRGACIRCRMLKKPCSGESPCSTCNSVESARLWKQPCIRTRIAEEMEMYSAGWFSHNSGSRVSNKSINHLTGLHAVLAYHDTSHVKSEVRFQQSSGRIEATHYYDLSIFITFNALEGRRSSTDSQGEIGQMNLEDESQNLNLLDSDVDDLPGKLEQYMKKLAATFYDREPSSFMRHTLSLVKELSVQKKDELLARVLELWIATHILVDLEMQWQTFLNPTMPAQFDPTVLSPPEAPNGIDPSHNHKPIEHDTNPETYALLCSQLRAAAEKRAAQLSKSVMNDLERRLLARQQSEWFETFLVAIVLFNCIEKMSWLFRSWEGERFYAKWPLDRRPPYYYEQGEHFADIVHMLLKMRGLPPKTQPRPEDGVLVAVEGSDEIVSRYLNTICISRSQLEERRHAVFIEDVSRSLELKYCSKLLLPTA
ncbi:MAG: hypothetical protein M1835_003048 [Candelina submexicana]|nr:MAG: hypothetical protein M1835_003048 [Candelina submexicana]